MSQVKQSTASKRKQALDQLVASRSKAGSRCNLNLVVVGHVDAGKSTLMGHLLYLKGHVDEREMHKYRRESQREGKGSFAFAWVLDQQGEERYRSIQHLSQLFG